MPALEVAEALYRAHKERATGYVRLQEAGRESSLALKDGELLGMELDFGFQSLAQSLLQGGWLDPGQLDALWARGEGGRLEAETLAELGITLSQATALHRLANLRRLAGLAQAVRFEPVAVAAGEPLLARASLIRAAFGAVEGTEPRLFRCPNPAACQEWLGSQEELELLSGWRDFASTEGASRDLLALLWVLEREGKVEVLEESEWRRREEERLEEERRRAEESRAEEAQLEEALRLAAEAEAARRVEEARLAEEAQAVHPEPVEGERRERSQEELLREMNEALLRAGAAPVEFSTPAEPAIVLGPEDELGAAEPAPQDFSVWGVPQTTAPVSSFEEALRQAESEAEQLAASGPAPQALTPTPAEAGAQPPLEGVVEAGEEVWPWEDAAAGDSSQPAEEARKRRQRLLRRAMQSLGGLDPGQGDHSQARQPAVQETGPAEPQGTLSAGDQEIAREIQERHRALAGTVDHFAVLGVGRGATAEEVRLAFLELAKRFHPDRLPPSLPQLGLEVTAIFEAIRQAHDTLRDEVKRAAYLSALESRAQPENTGGSEAVEAYKKGEALLRKRDWAGAREQLEHAHRLEPRASYLSAAAWALYMDPSRKAEAEKARQLMAEALRLDPSCDRAHYQLGVIARVEGELERAERHFREAVRANPKHLEANQELRLIEMRKKKEPAKRGFFK